MAEKILFSYWCISLEFNSGSGGGESSSYLSPYGGLGFMFLSVGRAIAS